MVHQFTGFVLISVPRGFSCPGRPDLSSECCKVSRGKPVRGRGTTRPGRKVLKWNPALGGLVCCPLLGRWRCWGGPRAGVQPVPVSPSALCGHLGAWMIRSPIFTEIRPEMCVEHWWPQLGDSLLWDLWAVASWSPHVLLSVFHPVPSTFSSLWLIICATRFCMCCSSPTVCDSWSFLVWGHNCCDETLFLIPKASMVLWAVEESQWFS